MQKISITIDLTKIDKSRIIERKYTNKAGEEVTAKEYKMEVVPMREENHKTIASGSGWAMVKKYFVSNAQTKEEREAKTNTAIIGEGLVFVDMSSTASTTSSPTTPEDTPW